MCEKDYIWNHATRSCEKGKYLGNIIDDLVIKCDEIIDAVPKSYHEEAKTNPTITTLTKNSSTNFYIVLHFLLITKALLIVVSIYRQIKRNWHLEYIIKMENNDELKEIYVKNCTCYYFDDIIKIEDFNFDNILINEKWYKNVLVYDVSNVGAKPLCIRFDKVDGFIRIYDKLNI